MDKTKYSRLIALTELQLTDSFWKNETELVRRKVIPYQWEALNDRIEGAVPSYCMRNYRLAGEITEKRRVLGSDYQEIKRSTEGWTIYPEDENHLEERFYGWVFQDSDVAKWIEAVGYSLAQHPDAELERMADEAIEIICRAQQENGYWDTYYILNDLSKVFTNLQEKHELYCFGHLTEGAIAYYQATGKDKLLKAVERYADYIGSCFGPEEGKKKGYPGHEVAEMALARLYELTGKKQYLELSRYFINERGKRPYYFDSETEGNPAAGEGLKYQFAQAHQPVREQEEAVGHAVRAVYLYAGMADVARLCGDEELYLACERLWNNITEKKMYITGGIGATHMGEAFSYDYDLPNDIAYAETCAAIGLIFFARRMLQIKADSRYANIMERALYNGVLSGMALDGKSFFYVNPLEVLPEACHKDERKAHVKAVRQKWFGCACCPPNIARLITSITAYAYTEREDTIYFHLYIGGKIKKQVENQEVTVAVISDFPWDGRVSITVETVEEVPLTLALRIPDWCDSYQLNGRPGIMCGRQNENGMNMEVTDGYLYVTKSWKSGEKIEIEFPMEVKLMQANLKVREDIGRIAVTRGPLVYCMEEADNGAGLSQYCLNPEEKFTETETEEFGERAVILQGRAKKRISSNTSLYQTYEKPVYQDTAIKLIPYYTWANRGEGEMIVWIAEYCN